MSVHPDFASLQFPSPSQFKSSGLSSSPARTATGVYAPDPACLTQAAGTAGAAPPPAPAPFLRGPPARVAGPPACVSVIRTEDGTVLLFDRATGQAVSGLTRAAAEAALKRLKGETHRSA